MFILYFMKKRLFTSIIILISTLVCRAVDGRDVCLFSKIDYQQGLSNSAVLCLFQDNSELMWFGTYDGVNCFDGKDMEIYRSDFEKQKTLSNNVIHSIQQADSNCLWITTHLGLNRFSRASRQVVMSNYGFAGNYFLHSNSRGDTWVVSEDGIYYYNTFHRKFIPFKTSTTLVVDDMDRLAFVADDGVLWAFQKNTGKLYQFSVDSFDQDTLLVRPTVSISPFHSKSIDNVFYQSGIICFIDSDQDLFVYDILRKSKIYIRNIYSLVDKYGDIKGIVPFYEDIIMGFRTSGLIRLRASHRYETEIIDRNIRIYDPYRDSRQGILWIASDGQSVLMYAKKYSIATNIMLNDLSANLSGQVRSLMTDKYGGLWFGTKGDGLLHIPNYQNRIDATKVVVYSPGDKQIASSYEKCDREFQIYKLKQSRYTNGFWAGGDLGLAYYSYTDDRLNQVEDSSPDPAIHIHDIYEENDSVLYVVTAAAGFRKLCIEKTPGNIRIMNQKRYRFFHEQREITMFYPMLSEGDSILWLGSREKGLIRFDKRTEEYQVISLKEILHKSVDDVLSMQRAKDGRIYIGTTSGLVSLSFQGEKIDATFIGREQGLLNDMIHGILEDANGLLWLGTNRGLIKYNPKNGASHAYYYSAGGQIGEFSDDAYYRCPYTGHLFFGGINGLLYLDKQVSDAPEYYPNILLRALNLGGTKVNLNDYYVNDGKALKFCDAHISFTLSFVVPDFLSGSSIEYSYKLDGCDEDWTSFSGMNEASYIDVPAGDYIFKVRYKKDVFDTEYKYFSIPIYILVPWYRSMIAYIFYFSLFFMLIGCVVYLLRKKYLCDRMMKCLLATENSQEYSLAACCGRDSILRMTQIYSSCDQLRAENLSYEQRCEKIELIRETVMIDLFNPEILCEENYGQFLPDHFVVSGCMCISEISSKVLCLLMKQGVNMSQVKSVIPDTFTFPVYKNVLHGIFYYCYFYIAQAKDVEVTINAVEKDGKMQLLFSTQGDVLAELYNGLSDFSCMNMEMRDTDKDFGMWILFRFVCSALKRLHATLDYAKGNENCLSITLESVGLVEPREGEKKIILLLEDREEIVWLISDLLSDEYHVHPVGNLQIAFKEIDRLSPALLLVDMTMYVQSENAFMEYISKHCNLLSKTVFIPMLTWKVSSTIQKELILLSDSYAVLPYDIPFLKEVVHKAIYGKKEPKRIYMEDLGDWAKEIVCTTNEQADFIRRFLLIVEQNLDREDLGSSLIADRMAMSPRQLYRKFKEISNMSPSDLIKIYRMEKAARLLLNDELSIQDVINDVGIASRSYFYKEFTRRFDMTPGDYRERHKGK